MTNIDVLAVSEPPKYHSVNSKWPETMPTLEGDEAIAAARRLYRFAMKKPFRGQFKLVSGNRFTWIRNHVFCVNPNRTSLPPGHPPGWHDLVHMLSHLCHRRLHPDRKPHDSRHEYLERAMIEHIIEQGWLTGKLRKQPKPKPDMRSERLARVVERIRRWETKKKRADTALRKLTRQRARYERLQA